MNVIFFNQFYRQLKMSKLVICEDLQIGFIALNKYGEFGSYALQKGFDFAVKSENHANTKYDSKNLI